MSDHGHPVDGERVAAARRGATLDDGLARLQAALGDLAASPLDEFCDTLLSRLTTEAGEDDVALIAVRAYPRTSPARRPPDPTASRTTTIDRSADGEDRRGAVLRAGLSQHDGVSPRQVAGHCLKRFATAVNAAEDQPRTTWPRRTTVASWPTVARWPGC